MIRHSGSFMMFSEEFISNFLANHNREIQAAIQRETEDFILNVNATEYITYLVETFAIDTPCIDFDNMSVSDYEAEISPEDYPEHFPFLFAARTRTTVRRQVVVFHLPFTGNAELFHFKPSQYVMLFPEVYIEDHSVCFEIINFTNNSADIQSETQSTINSIRSNSQTLINDLEPYNAQLPTQIEQLFKARKQKLLDNKNLLASLGVPLKKRDDLPATYAIPTPRTRKSLVVKPSVTEKGYRPEPALDQKTYHEILEIIHNMGKVFETLPGTYINKGEEELRDHLLLYLAPRFKDEGSVTGETFNKVGKTDILYRHNNTNVFVAECKFWKGQEQFLETISQLLSYLTWRDSKAAVIMFVRNKEISSVLETVKQVTPQHPNYLGFVNEEDTSWFNYRFHINDDPNREVQLAVMLYHIPSVYSGRVKEKT